MTQRRSRGTEAFFGRRKSQKLRGRRAELVHDLLPQRRIDLEKPAPADLSTLFPEPVDSVCLEIGFGGGEHLTHEAGGHPTAGFIGVEPFVDGMAKMLSAIDREALGNVRLYDDDATQLLDWLPEASLDRIDLLYPDPWPKKRHWKRRFVNPRNLTRFAHVLKPGGLFRFASDIDTYVNWTLQHIHSNRRFDWTAQTAADWRQPWDGWLRTRYEAKAIREGREPCYLQFRLSETP